MNQINLVPTAYMERERRKWYTLFSVLAGLIVVSILIALALIPLFKISAAKQEQERLTAALAVDHMVETRMILDETEQASLKNTQANKLIEELDLPSHITRQTMDVVVGNVPKGLRMNVVRLDQKDKTIAIEGYGENAIKIIQYITQLHNTGQFNILEYETNQDEGSQIAGWLEYSIKIQPTSFVEFDGEEKQEVL